MIKNGKKVKENFQYISNDNKDWISSSELKKFWKNIFNKCFINLSIF